MGIKTLRTLSEMDIEEFIKNQSDFAFELEVLHCLQNLHYKCEHSGTYCDPVTGKLRQFDIRAILEAQNARFRLSVECKRISDATPLVAHCLPRSKSEAYCSFIWPIFGSDSLGNQNRIWGAKIERTATPLYGYASYKNSDVCKQITQVWEEKDSGKLSITAKDSDIYEKWSQAVSSAHGLVQGECEYTSSSRNGIPTIIIPVLVIPNGTLWRAHFDETGVLTGNVALCDRVSIYIGVDVDPWVGSRPAAGADSPYSISHLEVVTFSALKTFTTELTMARD